jgi:glycosyltransferase involved in cell wall biosynthesis
MTTIHFVYPHSSRISCPDAIGYEVGKRLRGRYTLIQYDWTDPRCITPGPDDILLGHPHPAPWTIFQRSAQHPGWKRILVLAPFSPGYIVQQAFLDKPLERADRYLAITGDFWYSRIARSPFPHWESKMIQIDLAVERRNFPILKDRFNPPGLRRFLYIGHNTLAKNPAYLSQLAQLLPATEMAWIGGTHKQQIFGLRSLGHLDFRHKAAQDLVGQYDFLLTVGSADANPTTILEAMSWGLIPICTPQSGYVKIPGIPNVPLNDPDAAIEVLQGLQYAPEESLRQMQTANWRLLDQHFNWDRFTSQVIEAIEQPVPVGAVNKVHWTRKVQLKLAIFQSLYYLRLWYGVAAYALLRKHVPILERRYRAKHRL